MNQEKTRRGLEMMKLSRMDDGNMFMNDPDGATLRGPPPPLRKKKKKKDGGHEGGQFSKTLNPNPTMAVPYAKPPAT